MTTPRPEASTAQVPTKVAPPLGGRFRTLAALGEGGQGIVWSADNAQGQRVVLKQIATEVGAGARAVFACLRELASPHLPAVEEVVDDEEGRTWLVTRYVEGQALERGPAPVAAVLDEAIGTAHALAALHSAGTHHADISPGNVLVDPSGRAVLTDLGSLGATGFGTPGFVAPEVLRGGGGPASDLFGLACVMFWRLTGESPWPDTQALTRLRSPADLRRSVRPLYERTVEELPRALRSLLERMLHPDPRQRVADAKLVLRVLRQLREGRSEGDERYASTTWWAPARWPFFGPLRERVESLGARLAAGTGPRLVLVYGPPASGRGRVVEELVASLQLAGHAVQTEDAQAFDRPDDDSQVEPAPGQWLESWLAADASAGLRACSERVRWPARLQSDGEADEDLVGLRSALLLAGARLGRGTRVLVVSEALVRAVEANGLDEVEVLALAPASRESCANLLQDVIEGPRCEAWVDALYERTGGWPAQLVSWVEACSAAGAQDPNLDLEGLEVGGARVDMSEEEARALLARSWGFPVGLPLRWTGADASAPWVLEAAAERLAGGLHPWASELAENVPAGEHPNLAHALALGEPEGLALLVQARARVGEWLAAPLLRWVCEHPDELEPGSLRLAAEQLLSAGRNDEALSLCEREGPELEATRARALQRVGRAGEALELLRGRAEVDDELRGLGWRALVDLGRGEEALAEVRSWWSSSPRSSAAAMDAGACTAALWGALVVMGEDAELSREMLAAVESALVARPDRRSASLYARARQLSGNLAHLEGRPAQVRRAYADARDAFERAGEASAAVWLDGSLCALAIPAGELGLALTHGRRALRTLLARAELQALPGAVWNLVEALVRVDALEEAGSLIDAAARVCRAAQVGRGELLLLDACRAQVELARAARDENRVELSRAAGELAELAARLEETGHAREACASWLHDAAVRRVLGQPAASKHSRELARAGAEAAEDEALLLECALEALDYVRAFKTGPAWGGSLESAAAELSTHDDPAGLRKRGQLELAFRYDRSLYRALFRLHGPHHPACRALRRRAFESLEQMMSKTDTTDRAALRSTALNDHGDRGALSELLQGLVEDAQEGASAPVAQATPPSQSLISREQRASLLLRMYRRLAREDDLERLLAQVCDVMMELTDGERGVVVVTTGDERHEVLREFSNENDAPSFSRSVIERVLSSGDPVLSVDATQDARFDGAHSISHLNLRSVVSVPLNFRGERLGAAYVDHRLRRGAFGEDDLSLMEDFADLAALAVAQTRALTEARRRAEDLEKSREVLEAQLDERDAEVIGLRERVRHARDERETYRGMVGRAPAMQKLYRLIDRLSGSDVPVVIFGESGTGKELVARALHDAGPRAGKPFVAENCGAIPESLLESLFFGHARGAFTGANTAKAGLIEAAEGGTIFLDEIGEMSMGMQTKLLRVLQEGEIRRVGETKTRKVDVRVVAASNRDLEAMVECGAFRRDLFYRINVVRLELPPLRERREDILALIQHFAKSHGRPELEVSARALRQLMKYPWPGNVRELENEVQRWIALVEDKVRPGDLAPAIAGAKGEVDDPDDLALKPRIDRLERELIARALERTGGNQTHAAELLGLSRYGLQKKLKRLNESKAAT